MSRRTSSESRSPPILAQGAVTTQRPGVIIFGAHERLSSGLLNFRLIGFHHEKIVPTEFPDRFRDFGLAADRASCRRRTAQIEKP
ncbi:MAG: hypothetical protein ACI81R_001319 [Bradymonadia bacterium]|jgi:hypothetical protein